MQEKTNIQTSTLRVPKNILEEIKIYCRKAGKPVGEWVETAWKFIEKNDFDIYDKETTGIYCFPVVGSLHGLVPGAVPEDPGSGTYSPSNRSKGEGRKSGCRTCQRPSAPSRERPIA